MHAQRFRPGRTAGVVAALAAALASSLPTAAAAAEVACRVEPSLPEAYARPAADLHLPPEAWPEVGVVVEGRAVRPTTATHGQILLGREALFLYHLPVFMGDPRSHPHNFQVVMEVTFADQGGTSLRRYQQDRAANPSALYTARPQVFSQTSLVLEYPGRQPLRRLDRVAVVRGHFERGGQEFMAAPMEISRVVHFRGFAPAAPRPATPAYMAFGRGGELFLAHVLGAPPDFDQILAVAPEGGTTAEALSGKYLTLSGRANDATSRPRPGDVLACSDGAGAAVRLRVTAEPYCEAGELSVLVVGNQGFAAPRDCPPG